MGIAGCNNKFWQEIIDKYYPAGSHLRDIYIGHCRSVADEALDIARKKNLPLDANEIEAAAMLHDIGIFRTHAPSIFCEGDAPYICHGLIGGDLLRRDDAPEWTARVAERHTGAGLTSDEIARQNLPLPHQDFLPETLLEKLICYADKFYSKSGDGRRKDVGRVRRGLEAFGDDTLARFDKLHKLFS
ncbi:MAG: HDIG domain-containing protein [Muribaculaceae bacterium]|nr:HDIG domain-containing protein [Muribaculaceae bacterium]